MKDPITLLDVAGLIADIENLPGRQVPALVRRIRHLDANGLLPTIREDTGRREGRLDLHGACDARLYLYLFEAGLNLSTITKIRADTNRFRGANPGPGIQGISIAIDEIEQGKGRTLEIWLLLDRSNGNKYFRAFINGSDLPAKGAKAQFNADVSSSHPVIKMTVDLNFIFNPIISAFRAN